ncbi:hypothetical protein ACJMK2_003777 [Sinanodonta woodiana]|uniref:Phosphatidylserine synthase n=1 Tax=Sinanodonta woodiana TaxID=1069815 RepID=A0ABD3XZ88_SINWO
MASSRGDLEEEEEHFRFINERAVDDISLEIFYKPHTISLLTVSVLGLLYLAFTRDDDVQEENIWTGMCLVVFFFLIISILAFPNGPFTRPHPVIWRMVFGLSVFYFMMLLFVLFQNRRDVRKMIEWLYPDLHNASLVEKEYAVNCSQIDLSRIWSHCDVFAFAHFGGWALKALLIRHAGILWTISVMWEVTEVMFAHLLPNFAECWWDSWVLDVLLCNGLGIVVGMYICDKLEMRNYHWESIKDIHSTTGKIRRALLQFTPASWTHVRWLDPYSSYMRCFAVAILIFVWLTSELNTFFLKHIFEIPPAHSINIIRLFLISVISAPSIRQYFIYVTDTRCKRVGTQCWMFCAITFTEAIICIKFGSELFKQTEAMYVIAWFASQLMSSFLCVYLCTIYARRWKWKMFDDLLDEKFFKDKSLQKKLEDSIERTSTKELKHEHNCLAERNGTNLRHKGKHYANGHL